MGMTKAAAKRLTKAALIEATLVDVNRVRKLVGRRPVKKIRPVVRWQNTINGCPIAQTLKVGADDPRRTWAGSDYACIDGENYEFGPATREFIRRFDLGKLPEFGSFAGPDDD